MTAYRIVNCRNLEQLVEELTYILDNNYKLDAIDAYYSVPLFEVHSHI